MCIVYLIIIINGLILPLYPVLCYDIFIKAVKRIACLCTWDSNHLACESVVVNIFRHQQAKLMLNFYRL